MKSKLKAMFDDDRGVSPVIGVILMVAITVILAAVIGTFVLGLGDSLEQTPQAQLDAELNSDENIEVSHDGGDSINFGDINIQLDSTASENTTPTDNSVTLSVGESVEVTADGETASEGDTVTLVHTPSESIILEAEV